MELASMKAISGSKSTPNHEARTWLLAEFLYAFLRRLHADYENAGGRMKISEAHECGSCCPEYDDQKIGGGNRVVDGHGSDLGTGVVGGRDHCGHLGTQGGCGCGGHGSGSMGLSICKNKLNNERKRSLFMLAAVYFGAVGFLNTTIKRDLQGDSNATLSFLKNLAKANHTFFQVFVLVNIFGFATSSGALLIRGRGKFKSEVMSLACGTISFICMIFSFGVIVIFAFLSLRVLAVTGSDV